MNSFALTDRPAEPDDASRRIIRLDHAELDYRLQRSARRSIGLRIDDNGLTVTAPLRTRLTDIEQALRDKQRWILAKLALWRDRAPAETAGWCSGRALWMQGEALQLWLERGVKRPLVARDGNWLRVWLRAGDAEERVPAMLTTWYRAQALPHFMARVAHYIPQLGRPMPPVSLSNARSRWGSCTHHGVIRLNWRLIQAPLPLIDYVIAHELAHLLEMNHSPRFWDVVARLYPEHQAARRQLRSSGERYFSF